jgi:hypothetical protein
MNEEIINYKHIKESLKLILLNHLKLNDQLINQILEELDDATANNLTYLQTESKKQ